MTDPEHRIRDKQFGAIRKPFIVATPRPYVADLSRLVNGDDVRASLLAEVEALRTVLTALGISEVEAYQRGYSLNGATVGELRYRAAQAGRNDLTKNLDRIGPGLDDRARPMESDEPEADRYEVETDMLGRMALPFIVATPAAYIVDLQHASDSPDAERLRLIGMVGELRGYLRELGIGEAQAQAAGYSLNMVTWDRLQDSAMHLGTSSDLWRRMRVGTWQR